MERRVAKTPVMMKTRKSDKSPLIVGTAAVYYDGTERTEYQLWDNVRERIMPGAFTRAMKEDDVRGLFNHDPNQVLGRTTAGTMKMRNTKAGPEYQIQPGDTSTGRDVVEHLKRGNMSGSSFGFVVKSETWRTEDKMEIREINEVELFDVGPVTYPAYEATEAGVRSADGMAEARASHAKWTEKRQSEAVTEENTDKADARRRRIKQRRLKLMGLRR